MSIEDRFAGAWRLVAFHSRQRQGRPPLPDGYRNSALWEEVASAFHSYIAYCGRYRVDQERSEVIHEVESSLYPNWTGTEQRRSFEFSGNRLTLTARLKGGTVVNRLVWERVA
ncbi:MAG: lipocalin-like domain-containing protein [Acidobacteria bacterium]|nr:lipocalin-like domain-containing protein [Acidobacteriota bacterium]